MLESLPANNRDQLPPVAQNSLFKVLNEKQFVNLNDLLPENRTPFSGDKTLRANSMGMVGIKHTAKPKAISSFPSWLRAFLVLRMCRIAINPALALPMMKYSDYFAQLADPCRN